MTTSRNDHSLPVTTYNPFTPYGAWDLPANFAFFNANQSSITATMMDSIISHWMDELQTFPFQNSSSELSFSNFKNCSSINQLESWCTEDNNCKGAVVFNSFVNTTEETSIGYSIRVDPSLVPNTGNIYNSFVDYVAAQPFTVGDNYVQDQGLNGRTFWTLQFTMDRALTKLLYLNSKGIEYSDQLPEVTLAQYPFPEWNTLDSFFREAFQSMGMSMMLGWIFLITVLVQGIVEEKEWKLKEAAKMLGLRNWINWLSYFISSFIIFFPSVLMFTVITFALGKYTEIQILFFYFLGSALSVICMGFLLSTLFDNSRVAAAGTAVFFFLSAFPTFFMDSNNWVVVSRFEKILASFLSPTAWSLGASILGYQEDFGIGVTTKNIAEDVAGGHISFLEVLIMLYVDALLYLLLALYFDAIFPGGYGVPQNFNFFLKKSYWFIPNKSSGNHGQQVDVKATDIAEDPSRCEPYPREAAPRVGVQMKHLHKQFKGLVAVNNLSLNVYENEITAFLGHNGAGKTTTMNMLTGMIGTSSGDAFINGYSIATDMDMVRQSVGLCPQFDILYPHMTVREHLQFYCILKNVSRNEIETHVNEMLVDVQLQGKEQFLAKELSGGMRRKLSVAIALIGDSKVVFLDEPTAGMDPYARRATWELLLKNKNKRTILLTTHLMDEADLLGDRIAIVHSGRLFACGSSMFLKNKYGKGYHVTIVKHSGCKERPLTNVITQYAPDAYVNENLNTEITYVIPKTNSSKMPELFRNLERRKQELLIRDLGISETTLEEVFLRVGRIASSAQSKSKTPFKKESDHVMVKVDPEIEKINTNHYSNSVSPFKDSFTKRSAKYKAMFLKRFHTSKRDKRAFFAQLLIPLAFVLLAIAMVASDEYKPNTMLEMDLSILHKYDYEMDSLVYSSSQNETLSKIFLNTADLNYAILKTQITEESSLASFLSHLVELQTFWDPTVTFISLYSSNSSSYSAYYNNKRSSHSSAISLNFANNVVLQQTLGTDTAFLKTSNWPLPSASGDLANEVADDSSYYGLAVFLLFGFSFMTAYFAMNVVEERLNKSKHMQLITGVDIQTYWTSFLVWDFLMYLIPTACVAAAFLIYDDYRFVGENFAPLLVNMLAFGLASIPMAYVLSAPFSYPATGFLFVLFVNAIVADIFLMVTQSFVSASSPANEPLQWVFSILPGYAFSNDVTQIAQAAAVRESQSTAGSSPWSVHAGSKGIILMLVESVIFLGILYLSQREKPRKITALDKTRVSNSQSSDDRISVSADQDVEGEVRRVEDGYANKDLVKTDHLCKTYKRKGGLTMNAVRDLTFAVPFGECFGLLGVNGAGKTTTFKMLTGDIQPSSGDAYINQYSVTNMVETTRKFLGYCPQYDALLEKLNSHEVLTIYARLRGVKEKYLKDVVNEMITEIGLTDCADRLCGTYSGGNKRKLSTAISLIGKPQVVFLDEPTAGMDPQARRFIWNTISNVCKQGRSVVFTSHSMEECEALCSRIAIMVNGSFKCIGSPQHLKSRFGRGYTVAIRAGSGDNVSANLSAVRKYFTTCFPSAELKEEHCCQITFEISKEETCLANMFDKLETNKTLLNIVDYSISQTTLDMVFCNFASKQEFSSDATKDSQIPPHQQRSLLTRMVTTIAKWSPPGLIIRGIVTLSRKICARQPKEMPSNE